MSDTGWDIVAATTQGTINYALLKLNSIRNNPLNINQSYKIGRAGNLTVDCTLGALQLNALQQGQQIVGVIIPITTGTIKMPFLLGGGEFDLDGLEVQLEMALAYVESESQSTSGTNYNLIIDFTDTNAFVSFKILNSPPNFTPSQTALISFALEAALYALDDLVGQDLVIATVNIGGLSSYPALVPSKLYYTFNLNEDDADQTPFAVLIQTISTQEGSFELNPEIIPSGSTASVAISNNILMSELLLPALKQALGTQNLAASTTIPETITNTGDIPYSNDDTSITISNFSLSTSNGNFKIAIEGSQTVLEGLINVDVTSSATLAFEVGQASDGSQTLSIVIQGEPEFNVELSLPSWLSWMSWLLPIISPVIGLFVLAVEAIFLSIGNSLANSQVDSFEDSAIGFAVGQVQWNYAEYIVIQSVQLPDTSPYPLLIAGSLPSQIPTE